MQLLAHIKYLVMCWLLLLVTVVILVKQLVRESELQGVKFCSLPCNWYVAWKTPRSSNGLVCLPRKSNNRCLGCLNLFQPRDSLIWVKTSWSRLNIDRGQHLCERFHLKRPPAPHGCRSHARQVVSERSLNAQVPWGCCDGTAEEVMALETH